MGPALKSLNCLSKQSTSNKEPFDLIFIDEDRNNHCAYLLACLELSAAGTLIMVNNKVKAWNSNNNNNNHSSKSHFGDFTALVQRLEQQGVIRQQTFGSKEQLEQSDIAILTVLKPLPLLQPSLIRSHL